MESVAAGIGNWAAGVENRMLDVECRMAGGSRLALV